MSKWPMRGHFRYLRFETFSMTPRTPQCEVFWALLSDSKHSGVPEDSKSPTLGMLGFTPTLGQSGVATHMMFWTYLVKSITLQNIIIFFETKIIHVNAYKTIWKQKHLTSIYQTCIHKHCCKLCNYNFDYHHMYEEFATLVKTPIIEVH
jgi:hypothetical protein